MPNRQDAKSPRPDAANSTRITKLKSTSFHLKEVEEARRTASE